MRGAGLSAVFLTEAMSLSSLESRIVAVLWIVAFVAALAAFSIGFLTHANTFALVEPILRWLAPDASAAEISTLHILARKLGHFLIPAAAYLALVCGPLRNRRYTALVLCAIFAVLDETLQAFTPGRTGSIYDVALDISGALFSFVIYSVFTIVRRKTARAIARKTGPAKPTQS